MALDPCGSNHVGLSQSLLVAPARYVNKHSLPGEGHSLLVSLQRLALCATLQASGPTCGVQRLPTC